MSFDLVVWYEPWPVTGAEARQKLDRAYEHGDKTGFISHDALRQFRRELLARFPALEELDLADDTDVWSVTPDDSDRYVSMCMRYSKADKVIPVILDLAATHGLVCLDPQSNSVYLPPGLGRTVELLVPGRKLVNPDQDVLAHQVRRALLAGDYAELESEPGFWVQAGSGAGAGMRQDGYAVEYRDGSDDAHFRHETRDLGEVLTAFEHFRANDPALRTSLPWRRYG